MTDRTLTLGAILWMCAGLTGLASAAQAPGPGVAAPRRPAALLITPPAPVAPEVISRDAAGHATVRAIQLTEPLHVDGLLDEAVYQAVPAFGDFIQLVPKNGAPATEPTDVWVMFDGDNMYVAARCWDSAPPSQWVANEMRRDLGSQNDVFGVLFDTFYDHRNGNHFYTNPLGARTDSAITDESVSNHDWNPVWDVRTGRFDGGWTVEMAIPFKSLRYNSGTLQTWGIQFRRGIRRKNEWVYLTPLPAGLNGPIGIQRISAAATLVGLDLPAASKNLEFKPYATSRLTTDRAVTPSISNALNGDLGIDAKFGITANLTADLTYNTDFAQVEVDEQQVNLTRFSLLFPEKRDFFLEGRGIFDFGHGATTASAETPALFYSRRIGLNRNRIVPIDVGGRLTGKLGRFDVGVLNLQTGKEAVSGTPTTNFGVVRVKRDILRRSSIGAIFTNRSTSTVAPGSNQAMGVDAAFSFFDNVSASGYYARTETPGLTGEDTSYQARFDYGADRYGAKVEYLRVGDHFNPEVGFLRRTNFARALTSLRFSPRPKSIKAVRKFTYEATLDYFENGGGAVETRQQSGRFNIEFENSDQFTADATRDYEFLVRPFAIAPGVTVPAGGYQFSDLLLTYTFGQQRRASGTLSAQRGHFYDGTITALGYTGGRVSVTTRFSLQPSVSINQVHLPAGDFTTKLVRMRSDYAFSTRMFASALLQYSAIDNTFSSNLRFRWEYTPGSEFFIVYTDEHDTRDQGVTALKNRAFVLKINRLLRF